MLLKSIHVLYAFSHVFGLSFSSGRIVATVTLRPIQIKYDAITGPKPETVPPPVENIIIIYSCVKTDVTFSKISSIDSAANFNTACLFLLAPSPPQI